MLRIDGIKKSYAAKVLLNDVSYHFPSGERIAIVGANGAGKTTLLNIICGLEEPDDGSILIPQNTKIGYLPQKPNPSPELTVLKECESGASALKVLRQKMEAYLGEEKELQAYAQAEAEFRLLGGYALESRATAILAGLGFSSEMLIQNPLALSGGWRMRLELARLFMRSPDFLILDEPTNHLDLPSLVWVENYLQAFKGTLLFVSHDRSLLNRLSTMTIHLSHGKMVPYRGNFDQFLEQREAKLEQEQATRLDLKRRREAMEDFVARFGAKATKAAQAQSRLKMISKIRDLEEERPAEEALATMFIDIPSPPSTPRIVLEIESGVIGYSKPLASGIQLTMERGVKIAVIGANGIGKSTLLRTIAKKVAPLSGQFNLAPQVQTSYFAQVQSETLNLEKSILENLLNQSSLGEREARNLLGGFLFRGDEVKKPVKVLSGGEASRVGLACALARSAHLLLLDEPTNHLDMASVESLASSLAQWSGSLIFVSHDRSFIEGVATHIFAMTQDGRSMLFAGGLSDYVKLAEISGFPNVLDADSNEISKSEIPKDQSFSSQNETQIRDLKRKRQTLSKTIEKLDEQMVLVRKNLQNFEKMIEEVHHSNHQRIAELFSEKTAKLKSLEILEVQWLEASEALEEIHGMLQKFGRS